MSNVQSPTRHYCDHFECGKSFRRAEHLTRHKLNHTNSTIQCPHCDHLFYRRDLLQRHVNLKHGKSPRAVRAADPGPLSLVGTSPPTSRDGCHNHTPPAYGFQEAEDHQQFPPTPIAIDAPANEVGVDDAVLPSSSGLLPFPFPALDPNQVWGWLYQFPQSTVPLNFDPPGGMNSNNEIAGIPDPNHDWINHNSLQELFISQEVSDYLTTLELVVEVHHPFTAQDIGSLLNAGVQFVMRWLPIFHLPTFSLDLIPRELCASIFCVGLLIAAEPAFFGLGCALLGKTRSDLLQYVSRNTVFLSDLGTLQAMYKRSILPLGTHQLLTSYTRLLVEFSGMYLADRTAMELSDIFHGTLVTLARRLGLFETTYGHPPSTSLSVDESERQNAVEQESAKRLAYFVFVLDVEHALLFGHERSMYVQRYELNVSLCILSHADSLSIYSMKLELPSEEGDWEIPSRNNSQANQRDTLHQTRLHVLSQQLLLRDQGYTSLPKSLSQLSNLVFMVGLASVVLDLLRRPLDPFLETKKALSRLGDLLPAMHGRLLAGPDGPMKHHGRVIYHITLIALCTPLDDLERAANDGFSRTGRTPKQHTRAAMIRLLTKHRVGPEPARHAVHLLKLYLVPLSNSGVPSTQDAGVYITPVGYSPYEPSALYFAVLTLWAYIIGRVTDSDEDDCQLPDRPDMSEQAVQDSPASCSSASLRAPVAVLLQDMEAAIDNSDNQACRRHWRTIVQHATAMLDVRRNNNAQEYSQVLRSLRDNLTV